MAVVVLPDDLTTKLAAVNKLLQTIAEQPVSALDAAASVDVAAAVQALDEVDRSVQTKGWHWNREDSLELSPNAAGEIALPSNYLWVANAYWKESSTPVKVSERGRKLYNREDHSYIFSDSIILDMVIKLDWEEMPEYARQYIAAAGGRLFQGRLQGSRIVDAISEDEVTGAMALLEQREDEADEQNSIGGNRYVQRVLSSRGVRRRY